MCRKRYAGDRGLSRDVDPALVAFITCLEVHRARWIGFVGLGQYTKVIFGVGRTGGGTCAVEPELGFYAGFGGAFDEAENLAAVLFLGSGRVGVLGWVIRVGVDRGVNFLIGGIKCEFVGVKLLWVLWGWLI